MGMGSTIQCLNAVENQPFSFRPLLCQRDLNNALSEHLGASRSDITILVIVQDRWHLGITAD